MAGVGSRLSARRRGPLVRGGPLTSRRTAVVLALVVASASVATRTRAEVCYFAVGESSWGPLATVSGAGVDDCTPSGDDTFVVPPGAVVTVVDNLVWDGVSSGPSIEVQPGGELRAEVSTSRILLSLNIPASGSSPGLLCDAGSLCTLRGGYRRLAQVTQGVSGDLDEAGWMGAGAILPCPGWDDSAGAWIADCDGALADPGDRTGTASEIALLYPWSWYNADPGAGNSQLIQTLDAIETGELLCWYDPTPSTPDAPADENYCYQVVLADGDYDARGSVGILVLDVRQSDPANPRDSGYPLALRSVAELTATAPAAAGGRYFEVASTAISCPSQPCRDTTPWGAPDGVADRQWVGRFLQFADGEGGARQVSYRISRMWDDWDGHVVNIPACSGGSGTCDLFEIYDPRGFADELATGASAWITYGWSRGDSFYVLVPVVVTDADDTVGAGDERSLVVRAPAAGSSHMLQGMLVDDATGVDVEWESAFLTDYHQRDNRSTDSMFGIRYSGGSFGCLRCSFSGGRELATGLSDRAHVFVYYEDTGVPVATAIENLGVRYNGDDVFSGSNAYTMNAKSVRVQWVSGDADSCNLYAPGNHQAPTGSALDTECVDCLTNDSSPTSGTSGGQSMALTGTLFWGTPGSVSLIKDADLSTFQTHRDFLAVGGLHTLFAKLDGFVVALVDDDGNSIGGVATLTNDTAGDGIRVENGIIRDYDTGSNQLLRMPRDGLYENVAILNATFRDQPCAGVNDCRVVRSSPNTVVGIHESIHRHLTIAWNKPTNARAAYSSLDQDNAIAIEQVLVYGLDHSTDAGLAFEEYQSTDLRRAFQAITGAPTDGPELEASCLFHNKLDTQAAREGDFPSNIIRGLDPQLVDPASGRFDPTPGGLADVAGCGILGGNRGPGIRAYRRMHAWSHITPEYLGTRPGRRCGAGPGVAIALLAWAACRLRRARAGAARVASSPRPPAAWARRGGRRRGA